MKETQELERQLLLSHAHRNIIRCYCTFWKGWENFNIHHHSHRIGCCSGQPIIYSTPLSCSSCHRHLTWLRFITVKWQMSIQTSLVLSTFQFSVSCSYWKIKSEVFDKVSPPTKMNVSLYCTEVALAIPNGNGSAVKIYWWSVNVWNTYGKTQHL